MMDKAEFFAWLQADDWQAPGLANPTEQETVHKALVQLRQATFLKAIDAALTDRLHSVELERRLIISGLEEVKTLSHSDAVIEKPYHDVFELLVNKPRLTYAELTQYAAMKGFFDHYKESSKRTPKLTNELFKLLKRQPGIVVGDSSGLKSSREGGSDKQAVEAIDVSRLEEAYNKGSVRYLKTAPVANWLVLSLLIDWREVNPEAEAQA